MAKLVTALVFLFLFFSALAFLPRNVSARLLQRPAESRLWARLIGLLGIAWLALELITDPQLTLSRSFLDLKQTLTTARNTMGGMILGMLFALYTQDFERRQ